MGREIRRVPANWQHPKYTADDAPKASRVGEYKPLFEDYASALALFAKDIKEKGLQDAIEDHGGGPRIDDYVQYDGKPADWWQVYETVSEGTPVSPAFETPDQLIEYLVANGDFWDQHRGHSGWSRANAEAFVKDTGWAPSGIVAGGVFMTGVEAIGIMKKGNNANV